MRSKTSHKILFLLCLFAHTAAFPYLISKSESHDENIWRRISYSFKLDHLEHRPEVKKHIEWFKKNPLHIQYIAKRASPYIYFILEEVLDRDLPAELVLVPILESAFDPFAYSEAGAAGLWQFMPKTAEGVGLKQNWWYDGRRDVFASTHGALDYLMELHEKFDGDWLKTVAAYDAGQGTVRRSIRKNRDKNHKTDFWSLKLPKETQGYIPKNVGVGCHH